MNKTILWDVAAEISKSPDHDQWTMLYMINKPSSIIYTPFGDYGGLVINKVPYIGPDYERVFQEKGLVIVEEAEHQ